jgi:hypothetical protein
VEKFFREELTEAEEKALSELLASSEDAAERFVALAEAAYRRHGHPEPKWPEPPAVPPASGAGLKPWIGLLVTTILGLGVLWFMAHRQGLRAGGAGEAAEPAVPVKSEVREEAPVRERPGREKALEKDGTFPDAREPEPPSRPPARGSFLEPIRLDEGSSQKFSSISVKVNQAQEGPVQVRVLDMSGLEVTPLYDGTLALGTWVFDWDGKLPGGRSVAPGHYQIEVRSGTFSGKKTIRIQ